LNQTSGSVIAEIEGMAKVLGRGLYRGLLRDLARVWGPREVQDPAVLQRMLEHMRTAELAVRRLQAAAARTGPAALVPILRSLGFSTLERVDNLRALRQIVVELEGLRNGGVTNREQNRNENS
jgi:hypothetical protein